MSGLKPSSAAAVSVVTWWFVTAVSPSGTVQADIFKLTHGGQLTGIWLDSDQEPVVQYEIRLRSGGRIVLDSSAVQEVIREPDSERQYQLVVAEQGKDVAGHWAIAQWCRDHGFKQRRREHLQRILRLDADHAAARHALGHSFVRGHWMSQQEFMREQGYVRFKGRWQLPQQVVLEEAKRERDAAVRQWYRQLSLWRRELGTDRTSEFYAAIADVNDPFAVPALALLIQREAQRPVRLLYIKSLAGIGTSEAEHRLLGIALTDLDEEVVHSCLDYLAEARSPSIHQKLLEALRHQNNLLVNRAGVALERLGEDESVGALIDALNTQHVLRIYNKRSEQIELIPIDLQNRAVLSALVTLTGSIGYGFDEKAWKQWRFQDVKQAHAMRAQVTPVRRDKRP